MRSPRISGKESPIQSRPAAPDLFSKGRMARVSAVLAGCATATPQSAIDKNSNRRKRVTDEGDYSGEKLAERGDCSGVGQLLSLPLLCDLHLDMMALRRRSRNGSGSSYRWESR